MINVAEPKSQTPLTPGQYKTIQNQMTLKLRLNIWLFDFKNYQQNKKCKYKNINALPVTIK
jgi:hypothetical protein